jgi:AraC-like DNA-binding protein
MSGSGLLPAASNKGRAENAEGAAQAGSNDVSFRFEIIAPPAELAGWINTFYVIETEDAQITEIVPAYSAQLVVIVRGGLVLDDVDGVPQRAATITINAPQLKAAPCVLEGPALVIGASLTPVGWQALANLPADEVHNRLLPPATILSEPEIAMLEGAAAQCRAGLITAAEICPRISDVVAAARFALRPDHVAVVDAITRWLGTGFDPPLAELYDSIDLSQRQLQRLSRRYFGAPPAQVLKRVRAIRAAMLLANPALPDALRDDMMTGYFDQAHLIRDMRRYTGRTPTQLRARTLSSGLLNPRGHGNTAEILRAEAG